jgi:phage baseplate assembly protein W
MAIVNLNNLFKKPVNPNNSIKYVYQDFNTMSMEALYGNNIGAERVKNDLNVSYDIQAVQNSVVNILTTKKGQKILNPDFGIGLDAYLFEQVSDSIATVIYTEILNAIQRFEPRVQITTLQVIPIQEENLYQINLGLRVPTLKQPLTLKGRLQSDVITFI